jgi:uncharacterized protein
VPNEYKNKLLFVARANNIPIGMDPTSALKDTSINTVLYRSVNQFVEVLKTKNKSGLSWASKYYPNEIHESVQLNGQYDALKFIFEGHQFKSNLLQINPAKYKNEVHDIDLRFIAHYEKLSKNLGYTVIPPKEIVNNLGYACLNFKKWEKAAFFFLMNTANYPQDANVFDSLGDFYEAKGDTSHALANYAKALGLGNDAETRRKMETLQQRK